MTAEAITAFHEAYQKDSSPSPSSHYQLAMALNQNGENPAAVQEFKTALANGPSQNVKSQIEALLQKTPPKSRYPGAERMELC